MTRCSSCGRGLSGDSGPGGAGMCEGCFRLAYHKGRRLQARMRFETGLVILLLLALATYVRWFR